MSNQHKGTRNGTSEACWEKVEGSASQTINPNLTTVDDERKHTNSGSSGSMDFEDASDDMVEFMETDDIEPNGENRNILRRTISQTGMSTQANERQDFKEGLGNLSDYKDDRVASSTLKGSLVNGLMGLTVKDQDTKTPGAVEDDKQLTKEKDRKNVGKMPGNTSVDPKAEDAIVQNTLRILAGKDREIASLKNDPCRKHESSKNGRGCFKFPVEKEYYPDPGSDTTRNHSGIDGTRESSSYLNHNKVPNGKDENQNQYNEKNHENTETKIMEGKETKGNTKQHNSVAKPEVQDNSDNSFKRTSEDRSHCKEEYDLHRDSKKNTLRGISKSKGEEFSYLTEHRRSHDDYQSVGKKQSDKVRCNKDKRKTNMDHLSGNRGQQLPCGNVNQEGTLNSHKINEILEYRESRQYASDASDDNDNQSDDEFYECSSSPKDTKACDLQLQNTSVSTVGFMYTQLTWKSYIRSHAQLSEWESDLRDPFEQALAACKFENCQKKKFCRDLTEFEHHNEQLPEGKIRGWNKGEFAFIGKATTDYEELENSREHSPDNFESGREMGASDITREGARPKTYPSHNKGNQKKYQVELKDIEDDGKSDLEYGSSTESSTRRLYPALPSEDKEAPQGSEYSKVEFYDDNPRSKRLDYRDNYPYHDQERPTSIKGADGAIENIGSSPNILPLKEHEGIDAYSVVEYLTRQNNFSLNMDSICDKFKLYGNTKRFIENHPDVFSVSRDKVELNPRISLCRHHLTYGCYNKSSCLDLHVCDEYILGSCTEIDCIKGHNILTTHNRNTLQRFFMEKLESTIIFAIIQITFLGPEAPQELDVCQNYNFSKCKSQSCRYLHICCNYVGGIGTCSLPECSLNHDLQRENCLKLLQSSGIDINNSNKDEILLTVIQGSSKLMQMVQGYSVDDQTPKSPNQQLSSAVVNHYQQPALENVKHGTSKQSPNTKFTLFGPEDPQELDVCQNYNFSKCKIQSCRYLHICCDYVGGIGTCCRPDCSLNHDLRRENCLKLLQSSGMDITNSNEDEILITVIQSSSKLNKMVQDYSGDDQIPKSTNQQLSSAVVNHYQQPAMGNVKHGTSKQSPNTKLNNYGQVAPYTVSSTTSAETESGRTTARSESNNTRVKSQVEMPSSLKSQGKKLLGAIASGVVNLANTFNEGPKQKQPKCIDNSQKLPNNFATVWSHYPRGDVEIPEICFHALIGVCKFESTGCKRLHAKLRFHWQFKINKDVNWMNFQDHQSCHLEQNYSNPSVEGVRLPQGVAQERPNIVPVVLSNDDVWYADFEKMELCNNASYAELTETCRLRHLHVEGTTKSLTHRDFLWYFKDNNDTWVQYGNTDTLGKQDIVIKITSVEIERRYQNKYPTINFRARGYNYNYTIFFKTMMQKNHVTGAVREVRRRPTPLPVKFRQINNGSG